MSIGRTYIWETALTTIFIMRRKPSMTQVSYRRCNMSREVKDGVRHNFIIEKDISEELVDFCKRTGRTKTKVVEIAIKEFLERHKDDK